MALAPNILPFELANAGREYKVTTNDDGKFLFFGNASDGRVGTIVVQFDPGLAWNGSFAVVGRVYGKPASDNGVGFVPIPYKRVSLDNVASDRALVSAVLTSTFIIEIPANGMVVALLTSAASGTGVVYNWPLNGPST